MVQGGGNDDDGDDDAVEKVAATRMRVLQMIHPDWNVKKKQVGTRVDQNDKKDGLASKFNRERGTLGCRIVLVWFFYDWEQ